MIMVSKLWWTFVGLLGYISFAKAQLGVVGTQLAIGYNLTLIRLLTQRLDMLYVDMLQVTPQTNELMEQLLPAIEVPVILNKGQNIPVERNIGRKRSRDYFFVLSSEQIERTLQRFGSRAGINFLALLDVPDSQKLFEIAHNLWMSKGIYKIFYMLNSMRTLVYNPFELAKGSSTYGAIQSMNEINLLNFMYAYNLNKYPLRVYIFDSVYSTTFGNGSAQVITHATGADAEIAYLLAKKMNFKMALQWPDDEYFGYRLKNGSFNGAIGRMIRYETDITLTGFFVKDYLTNDIEFSVAVYMDQLCCYVMKAKRIPQSLMPLFAVPGDVWLGFFCMGLASALTWMVLRRFNINFGQRLARSQKINFKSWWQYVRVFTDTCCCWVRVSLERLPPYFTERIFMVALCLTSVIFGAVFESSLATVYIRPLYYDDINTLAELNKAGLQIYIKHAAMRDDLFYGTNSPLWDSLNTQLTLVGETEERLIAMMAKRGGFCAVTRASSLILDDIRYFVTNKIHMIPECPKQYHIAFVMPRHSPYARIMNIWILKFSEAGLVNYWIDRMKYRARITMHKFADYNADNADQWKVLQLNDLQLSFYALICGCTLAGISFLIEICMHRRLREKTH